MGQWRTHDQLVAAMANGPIVYGCAALNTIRTIASVADVPIQSQIDADEAACIAEGSSSSGLTTSQVNTLINGALMGFSPPTAQPDLQRTVTGATTATVTETIIHADTTAGTFAIAYPAGAANAKIIGVQWSAGTVAPTIAFASGASLSTANTGQIAFSKVGALVSLQSDGNGVWTEV